MQCSGSKLTSWHPTDFTAGSHCSQLWDGGQVCFVCFIPMVSPKPRTAPDMFVSNTSLLVEFKLPSIAASQFLHLQRDDNRTCLKELLSRLNEMTQEKSMAHGLEKSTCLGISVVKVLVTQLCLTLCNPIDCSPPVFFVHGILQARKLEWVAIFLLWTNLPNPGIEPRSFTWLEGFFTSQATSQLITKG